MGNHTDGFLDNFVASKSRFYFLTKLKKMKIKLEKLNKTYLSKDGSKIKAVSNVSLDIPENKIFGIIGKSGAGKSSVLSACLKHQIPVRFITAKNGLTTLRKISLLPSAGKSE